MPYSEGTQYTHNSSTIMFKKALTFLVVAGLLVAGVPLLAQRPATTPSTNPGGQTVFLPSHAVEVAPGIFSLGSAVDPATGRTVEGFALFHHRNGHDGGPPGGDGGDGGGDTTSSCFAHLAKDAEWKTVENWVMNPSNSEGLDETTLFNLQNASLEKWEAEAGTQIFNTGTQTSAVLSADTDTPDGDNEVYFGDVGSDGAIAVTIVWGIFRGNPANRELVEWDQVYDQVDFNWSTNGTAGTMDFDNIATHENGHAAGLGHPDDSCSEETMYAFAIEGETKKRSLHDGDIAGIKDLY